MPRRAIYPTRNNSDTLPMLCRRYGDIVLGAIAKGKAGVRPDSLKVKLISFYAKEGLEFTREKERIEFEGHNLQSLKYDATRLFIKIAAQEIVWRDKDLFVLAGEVTWSLDNQAYASALEICLAARSIALEREDFQFALQILELEREALDRIGDSPGIVELKGKNLQATLDCLSLLDQINKVRLASQLKFEPVKERWNENEIVPAEMIHELGEVIHSFDISSLGSNSAKLEYLSMAIPFSLHTNDCKVAELQIRNLLDIYEKANWLIAKHPLRHLSHLRAACLLFTELGHLQEARRLLEGFLAPTYLEKGFELDAKYSWLRCALMLAFASKNQELRSDALKGLESATDELWEHVGEKSTIVVLWVSMINYLEDSHWRKAHSLGSRILMMKSKLKIDILVNVRIAMFACEVCLFMKDFQRIESSYDAIDKFIFRNRGLFPKAGKILKAFYRLWVDYSKKAISDDTCDRIVAELNGNLYASESRNSGYFDFKGLLSRVSKLLKIHQ